MPGENIQDWSTSAVSNSNADSLIDWSEGMPRASVNNSARSMMAAIAKDRNLGNGSIVTSGTANAQAFTSGVGYTTVPTGLRALLKIGVGLTNTGAVTLDMDSIGAVALKYPDGSDLETNELTADSYADVVYSGTNWVLLASIPPDAETATPPGVIPVIPPVTVSGATLVDFTTNIDDTFDHYIINFYDVVPSISAGLLMRFSINGGTTFVSTATYYNAFMLATYPTTLAQFNGSISTAINCSTTITPLTSSVCSGTIDLYKPSLVGKPKHMIVKSAHWNSTDGMNFIHNSGLLNTTSAINGIRFLMQSGTISGTFDMFGMKT